MGKGKSKNPDDVPYVDIQTMPLLLNEKQCAAVCGVSVAFLRQSRCEGRREGRTPGPAFVKLNGNVRYPRDVVFRWVESLERRMAI